MELIEDTRYAGSVGRVRALETRFLTKEKVHAMIEAADINSVWREIGTWQTNADITLKDVDSPDKLEDFIFCELKYVQKNISELSFDKDLTDLFFIKYDFHNIKVLLKKSSGDDASGDMENQMIEMGLADVSAIRKAIEDNNFDELPGMLKPIKGFINDDLRSNPELIDIVIDKKMYSLMLKKLDEYKDSPPYLFLSELFRTEIDAHNLSMIQRIKQLGRDIKYANFAILDGGKIETGVILNYFSGDTGELLNYCKNHAESCRSYIKKLWTQTLYTAFGIEPVIYYFKRKEEEASIIRIIALGKMSNLPKEKIKDKVDQVWLTLRQ